MTVKDSQRLQQSCGSGRSHTLKTKTFKPYFRESNSRVFGNSFLLFLAKLIIKSWSIRVYGSG